MVSLIERDHALKLVSFCSNHDLGTALPPPSGRGLRRKGPVTCGFVGSRPATWRRPRAVAHGNAGARGAAPGRVPDTARSTDLQLVPVLTSLLRRSAPFVPPRPRSPLAIRQSALFADARGLAGAPVPFARRPSAPGGLPIAPSAPPREVPGFGAVIARPARSLTVCRPHADVRSVARAGRR